MAAFTVAAALPLPLLCSAAEMGEPKLSNRWSPAAAAAAVAVGVLGSLPPSSAEALPPFMSRDGAEGAAAAGSSACARVSHWTLDVP